MDWIESAANMMHIVIMVAVLLLAVRQIGNSGRSMTMIFFAFGVASCLLSDLYWLFYEMIRPEMRMPFAANEFAEAAMFLLLASAVATRLTGRWKPAGLETVGPVLFAAACTGLWIGWSGEWLQDILTGIVYGYYLCMTARCLSQNRCLPGWQAPALAVLTIVLIIMQALTFLVPAPAARILDILCYVLMFAGIAFFFALSFRAVRRGASGGVLMGLSFGSFGWVIGSMYMSAGVCYNVMVLQMGLVFPLMLHAVRKEVGKG